MLLTALIRQKEAIMAEEVTALALKAHHQIVLGVISLSVWHLERLDLHIW